MGILGWVGDLFGRRDAADWAAEARDRLGKGKAAKALAAAEKAVALAPEDADMLILRSEMLIAVGDKARAADDLLAALDRQPGRAAPLLPRIEELEASSSEPERLALHAWAGHSEKGDLGRAADRVRRLAGRGNEAVEALRNRCREMIEGGGDRKAALFGLAILAKERGEDAEAVKRIVETAAAGGRGFEPFAERTLAEIVARNPAAPGAVRELAASRLRLGKTAEAQNLVTDFCRKNADAGVVVLRELRGGSPAASAFALELMVGLEQGGPVPAALSILLADGLLDAGRAPEAGAVLLRAVIAHPEAAESILPAAVRAMKADGGLDAFEAHGRAAVLAGDPASALLTVGEFVEQDAERALAIFDVLPAEARGDAAPLVARAKAVLGDHDAGAGELRRWGLGSGGARAADALPHAAAAAQAHPEAPAWGLLHHDLLHAGGDHAGAGRVLAALVDRHPDRAADVAARAEALVEADPAAFEARLAAGRAGLVRATDPGAAIAHFRAALDSGKGREAEVLESLEGGRRFAEGVEPVELFRAGLLLRAGRVDEGLAPLEEIVHRNADRGDEALSILGGFQQGAGAGDARPLFAEHRIRRALDDAEGSVAPLRRAADQFEDRRGEALEALDAVVADAPACRAAHRAGVEVALKLGRPGPEVLKRLETLLDVPTGPKDTEYVSRRAATVQAAGATVQGHRLLVRCHLLAQRGPLVLGEVRKMVALDPGSRAEAAGFLAHHLGKSPGDTEARFQMASIQSSLGDVDAAREALAGAAPRTEEVFAAWQRLLQAYPAHRGARLDLVDALVAERRLDEALEEGGKVVREAGGPGPDVVERIERVLAHSPEYAPALYALADVHHAAGSSGPEIEAYRRVMRLSPREAETILGRLDAILDRDPRCLEAALEVIRLVPKHGKVERAAPEAVRGLAAASTPADAGRIADALKPLEKKLGEDGDFREAMATSLARAGRAAPAVKAWNAILDDSPERAPAAEKELVPLAGLSTEDGVDALRALAVARLLAGRPAEACETADRFLERRRSAAEDARSIFRRALAAHPMSREAADGVARTSVLVGDADAAVAARLHLLKHHPAERRAVGRDLEALRKTFPEHGGAPLALAEHVHLPLDLHDDAAAALEAALALDPSLHRKALELVEVVLARVPKSMLGTRARARALAAAGRADEAVAGFRALADLDPRCLPDALEGFDSVLEDAPAHAEARYRRAEVLVALGRAKDAVEALDALLGAVAAGDEMERRALLMLASARESLEDFDGARDAIRLAGKHHPSESSVPVRLRANRAARLACEAARHRAARVEGQAGDADLDLAEALLEAGDAAAAPTAAGPEPGGGAALSRWRMLRGRAFLRLGAPGDAVDELEKAIEVPGTGEAATPAARDALFYGGMAQLRMGEIVKAIRRLEQAAHVDPAHRRVRDVLDRIYAEERRRLERPTALTEDLETLIAARKAGDRA